MTGVHSWGIHSAASLEAPIKPFLYARFKICKASNASVLSRFLSREPVKPPLEKARSDGTDEPWVAR